MPALVLQRQQSARLLGLVRALACIPIPGFQQVAGPDLYANPCLEPGYLQCLFIEHILELDAQESMASVSRYVHNMVQLRQKPRAREQRAVRT